MSKNRKNGNVFISIGILILIMIVAISMLLYYQVNIIAESIRKDLFYAANTAILAFNTEELSYRRYNINKEKTKQIMQEILNENYTKPRSSIANIKILYLDIKHTEDNANIAVEIEVAFKAVVNLIGKNDYTFKMKEDVNISLLNY